MKAEDQGSARPALCIGNRAPDDVDDMPPLEINCHACGHPIDDHYEETGCGHPDPIHGFCQCSEDFRFSKWMIAT